MNKIAVVFPGQASQYVGMGKEFYEKYSIAKEIFNKSNEIIGYDLKKIIFEGPLELLTQTKHTQPAVFITSFVCFKVFTLHFTLDTSHCLSAGHSLGEYTSLVASEVLSFEDGLKLVDRRAEFIQSACEKKKGTMLAVLGVDATLKNEVSEICVEAGRVGICEIANFNAPGQIVISGEISAIEKAKELAKTKKIKVIPLAVSGAFHSSLMKEASEKMGEEIYKYNFKNPKFQVVTNYDAEITTTAEKIPEKLIKQITSPVLWTDSINNIFSNGCEIFIEFGPKNILSGMIKRILPKVGTMEVPTVKTLNIENEATLNQTLEALKNTNVRL